jgi:hypothetical protein
VRWQCAELDCGERHVRTPAVRQSHKSQESRYVTYNLLEHLAQILNGSQPSKGLLTISQVPWRGACIVAS